MFVACSPHIFNRSETIRALRFAVSAKKVKNKAKKNEEQSPCVGVFGLDWDTSERELERKFSKYGRLANCVLAGF